MFESNLGIRDVLTRVYLAPEDVQATLAFYQHLFGGVVSLRFAMAERGLELVTLSSPAASFLLLAGAPEALEPVRRTALTVVVDDLQVAKGELERFGATELTPIRPVPTGFQMRYRHPDGLIVEYVEHTAAADKFRLLP